jgi:hypothetical protein
VALAAYFKTDILLLDEPTNHLDAESVACLEHHSQGYAEPSSGDARSVFSRQRGGLDSELIARRNSRKGIIQLGQSNVAA